MIKSLLGLKGVLAIIVFMHHLNYGLFFNGTNAVSYFFVLSGFLVSLGYHDKFKECKADYYISFLKPRLVSSYPIHIFTFLLSLFLEPHPIDPKLALLNLSLFSSFLNLGEGVFKFNAVSWYLSTTVILGVSL